MQYSIIPSSTLGIDKKSKRTLIDQKRAYRLENMFCKGDHLEKAKGYTQLGDALIGTGMEIINFSDGGGSKHLIAVTTSHIYEYNGATEKWVIMNQQLQCESCDAGWTASVGSLSHPTSDMKEGTACMKQVLVANVGATPTKLSYSASASPALDLTKARDAIIFEEDFNYIGFWIKVNKAVAANSLSLVLTEDAAGAKTTVYQTFTIAQVLVADTWTYIEIAGSLASVNAMLSVGLWGNDLTASAGEPLHIYLDDIRALRLYTGTSANKWSWTVAHDTESSPSWTASTALVLTNGKDKPICWDGVTTCFNELFVDTSEFTSFVYTSFIFELDNFLFFCAFNDGTMRGLNLKWADQLHCIGSGAFVDGTTGEAVVPNTRGKIVKAVQLDDKYVIYCEKSLGIIYPTGTTLLFDFINLLPLGLFSFGAIARLTEGHVLIGSDNKFYLYAGNKQITRVGRLTEQWFFDRLDSTKKNDVVLCFDENRNRLFFFYADYYRRDTSNTSYIALNLDEADPAWEEGTFQHGVNSMAVYDNQVAATCDSPAFVNTPCNQDPYRTMPCNATILRDGYSTAVFITSDGYVFTLDNATGLQGTAAIACVVETGSFVAEPPHERLEFRTTEFAFNARKSTTDDSIVSVYYSIDDGVTWTEFEDSPVTLTTTWTTHVLNLDVKATSICFKLEQSSGDFWLADYGIKSNINTRRG